MAKSDESDDLKMLYDRLKKETELSEKIKKDFYEVCNYMWENKLEMIKMEYATGKNGSINFGYLTFSVVLRIPTTEL